MDPKAYAVLTSSALEKNECKDWNEWRAQHPTVPDLQGMHVARLDVIGADLSGVAFNNSAFEKCSFQGVDFSHSDFENSKMSYLQFYDCNFQGTNFRGVNLGWSSFTRCILDDVEMEGSKVYKCDFRELDLSKVHLDARMLQDSFLTGVFTHGNAPVADDANLVTEEFKDVPLEDVMKSITKLTKKQVLITRNVDRRMPVTIRLHHLSVEHFLKMLCKVYRLELQTRPGMYGEEVYYLSRLVERTHDVNLGGGNFGQLQRFIELFFSVPVVLGEGVLPSDKLDIVRKGMTLRQLCVEVCKQGKVRFFTRVFSEETREYIVTESRHIDFQKVKEITFYRV